MKSDDVAFENQSEKNAMDLNHSTNKKLIAEKEKIDGRDSDENNKNEVFYKLATENGSLDSKNSNRKKDAWFLYLCAFTAYLTSFSGGVGLAWSSPVFPKMAGSENPFSHPVTATHQAWIAATVQLGAAIGPFASGYCADRFGRKKALIFLAVPMLIGNVILAFATNIYWYYVARFLVGIGVGSQFAVVPIYVSEIAEKHNRGTLGCFLGVFCHTGLAYPLFVGPHLNLFMYSLSCAIPMAIFLVIFIVFMPETPHYLISVGQHIEAEQSLRKLRNKNAAELRKELDEIKHSVVEQNEAEAISKKARMVKEFYVNPVARKALLVSFGLVATKQLSGINPLLSFLEPIFRSSRSTISPITATSIIGFIQVVSNFACFFVIEKLGRRALLQISISGCGTGVFFIGVFFFLKMQEVDVDVLFWLPVSSLVLYMVSFSMGLGFLPWCIMGEILPPSVKGVGSAMTSSVSFIISSVVTFSFPLIRESFGMYTSFWTYAIFCAVGMVFVYFCVPETRGKSLAQIQDELNGKVSNSSSSSSKA